MSAEEITQLKDHCIPCTSLGYFYCRDDPNLINMNRDRCYSSLDDKNKYCKDFDFLRSNLLCDTVNITFSNACDILQPEQFKWNKPWRGELKLKPMSSCGWVLKQYSAYMDITWTFPVSIYHRDYKTIKVTDGDFIVPKSDDGGKFPGNKCYEKIC